MKLGIIYELSNFKPKSRKELYSFLLYLRDKYYPYLSIADLMDMIYDTKTNNPYLSYTAKELKEKLKELMDRLNKGEDVWDEIELVQQALDSKNNSFSEYITKLLLYLHLNKIKLPFEDLLKLDIEDINKIINNLSEYIKEVKRNG